MSACAGSRLGHATATGPGTPFRSVRIERVDPVDVFVATAVGRGDPAVELRWGPPVGGGVGRTRDDAAIKALAEALERRAAFAQPRAPLQYGTADVIAGAVRPVDFPAVNDPPKPMWWVGGRRLGAATAATAEPTESTESTASTWFPLERVQLGCPSAVTSYCPDTTGLAVHPDRAEALRRGWLEVIERVGVRRLWDRRVTDVVGSQIFADGDAELASALHDAGYRVRCLVDRPLPGVAVVVVLLIGEQQYAPGLVCGTGSGTTLGAAAGHGLREAFGQLVQALEIEPLADGATLDNAFDHLRFYLDPRRSRPMLEAWGVLDAAIASDPEASWQRCRAIQTEPAFFSIDRGIEEADALDLHVVQVVAPELTTIDRRRHGARGWHVPFG